MKIFAISSILLLFAFVAAVSAQDGLDAVTVRAAKAAGMRVIAVPEAHNRGREEYALADYVLESLESLAEGLLTA